MKLLFVEDEPRLKRHLAQRMREDGYAVDTAAAADDAMGEVSTYHYDAILADVITLPHPRRLLTDLHSRSSTPVLLLAGDNAAERARWLDLGADDCLSRPFDFAELLARLRAVIRRSAGGKKARITLGDVVIDTTAHPVIRPGQKVTLTAREDAILEYLALHRQQLVTRSALYDHIFDEGDHTLSNVLDVYVFKLRQKLGLQFITTRRGQGYTIES